MPRSNRRACPVALPLSLLLTLFASPPFTVANNCPAFVDSNRSCGPHTCGKFVFRGAFKSPALRDFRVKDSPDGIRLGHSAGPADCCRQCRQRDDCAFWNFFTVQGHCFLYTVELCGAGVESAQGNVYAPNERNSYVGGRCNSKPYADQYYAPLLQQKKQPMCSQMPLPPTSFCLVSDPELHINMLLTGYRDNRTQVLAPHAGTPGAKGAGGGAKIRTWIREIGILWSRNGKHHSVKLSARRGAEQDRGDGFMGSILVDGVESPRLMLGDELNLFEGQGSILFDSYEKVGPYDVDLYVIKVEGVLEAELRVRAAHQLLQEADDAEVHFQLDILDVAYSSTVHGVLGQSYRDDSSEKTLNYAVLSSLIGAKIGTKVDGLEGHVEDYRSSSSLVPDCRFSQFQYIPELGHGDSDMAVLESMGVATQKARFLTISSSSHDL